MHSFALTKADDPEEAIAAHASDEQLAFIAGGTDLLGLMKDRAVLPARLLDINGLPDMARIEPLGRRRPAHRRAGPHERYCRSHGGPPALSGHRRKSAVRRVGPAAQHGVDWWKPPAAHPLRLFPG